MEYFATRHAMQQMQLRGVTWSEVVDVLNNAEVTYKQGGDPTVNQHATVFQAGKLFVVRADTAEYLEHDGSWRYAVLTVGLRSQEQWSDKDVRDRSKR